MIGILFLYYIGKAFSELAHQFNKGRWLFAILGIVVFYAAQILGGIVIAIVAAYFGYDINEMNQLLLNLIGIPIGGLACWGFYKLLKKRWSREDFHNEKASHAAEIIDDNLIE